MPTLTETVEMYRAGDISGADLVLVLHRDKIPSDVVALIAELHELAMLKRKRWVHDHRGCGATMSPFEKDLKALLNTHSMENASNTQDWVLAHYLVACLDAFNQAQNSRIGRQTQEPPLLEDPPDQTQPAWKGVDQPFTPASKFRNREGLAAMPPTEAPLVYELGERIGYGRLMQLAEQLWAKSADAGGRPGANHTCGPCAALLVPCTHQGDEPHKCDWCAGTGRVTKHVAGVMEREAMTKVSLEEGRTIVTPINEVLEDLAVRRSKE